VTQPKPSTRRRTENGLEEVPWEPQERVVEQLEQLLAYAKTGELRGIFSIMLWQGQSVSHCWAGGLQYDDIFVDHPVIIGELALLQQDLINQRLEKRNG